MKRREWLTRALAALGLAGLARTGLQAQAAKRTWAEEFGPDWEVAKAYTLEVANAMPDDKYSFKPAPEMRSFGELMGHTAGSIYAFMGSVRGEATPVQQPKEATKEIVTQFMTAAFDHAGATLGTIDDSRAHENVKLFGGRLELPVWKVFHFMRDHITHHRAYGLPYLRLCGVQPPRYRFSGARPSPV